MNSIPLSILLFLLLFLALSLVNPCVDCHCIAPQSPAKTFISFDDHRNGNNRPVLSLSLSLSFLLLCATTEPSRTIHPDHRLSIGMRRSTELSSIRLNERTTVVVRSRFYLFFIVITVLRRRQWPAKTRGLKDKSKTVQVHFFSLLFSFFGGRTRKRRRRRFSICIHRPENPFCPEGPWCRIGYWMTAILRRWVMNPSGNIYPSLAQVLFLLFYFYFYFSIKKWKERKEGRKEGRKAEKGNASGGVLPRKSPAARLFLLLRQWRCTEADWIDTRTRTPLSSSSPFLRFTHTKVIIILDLNFDRSQWVDGREDGSHPWAIVAAYVVDYLHSMTVAGSHPRFILPPFFPSLSPFPDIKFNY